MHKFNHNSVIKRYEIDVSFKKVIGKTLDKRGKSVFEYQNQDIKIAYFQVTPNELNESNGFESGDLKVFCRNNQKNSLSENDIISAFRTEYIIKNEIPFEYADYKVFVARRVVDSVAN